MHFNPMLRLIEPTSVANIKVGPMRLHEYNTEQKSLWLCDLTVGLNLSCLQQKVKYCQTYK